MKGSLPLHGTQDKTHASCGLQTHLWWFSTQGDLVKPGGGIWLSHWRSPCTGASAVEAREATQHRRCAGQPHDRESSLTADAEAGKLPGRVTAHSPVHLDLMPLSRPSIKSQTYWPLPGSPTPLSSLPPQGLCAKGSTGLKCPPPDIYTCFPFIVHISA